MQHSEHSRPAVWLMLQLPGSESDRTARLASLLHDLRIPAAVRHSMLTAGGTFAMVPSDGTNAVLTVPDSYSPSVTWAPIDIDTVAIAVEQVFGVGASLGGLPLLGSEGIRSTAGETSTIEAPQTIDGIAWTTREKPDVLSMLGSRLDMSFDAIDIGTWGRVVRPHLTSDRVRAFERGLWTMTDGVAFWRSGALTLDRGHGVGSVMPLPRG